VISFKLFSVVSQEAIRKAVVTCSTVLLAMDPREQVVIVDGSQGGVWRKMIALAVNGVCWQALHRSVLLGLGRSRL
jgi:hypothetical protein